MKGNIHNPFSITETVISTWRIVIGVVTERPGALVVCLLMNAAVHRWQAAVMPFPVRAYGLAFGVLWENFKGIVISSITVALYSAPAFVVVQNYVFSRKVIDKFYISRLRSWLNIFLCFVVLRFVRGVLMIYLSPRIHNARWQDLFANLAWAGLALVFWVWLPARLSFAPVYFLNDVDAAFYKSWSATSGRACRIVAVYFVTMFPVFCVGFSFVSHELLHGVLHESLFLVAAAATAACFKNLTTTN